MRAKIDYSVGSIHNSVNYGLFKILELDHIDKNHIRYYKIQFLETGYETIAMSSNIRSGKIKDYSYNNEFFADGSIHESNNYGSFKILELDHIDKNHIRYYKIQFLETGYITTAAGNEIKSGKIKDHLCVDKFFTIGSIHKSNNYGLFKILELDHIDKYAKKYYKIQFLETGYVTVVRANHIKDGAVADPFVKTICGIGYLGMEKVPKGAERDYTRWNNMIRRCYNPNDQGYVNYGALGITVCERWHCFKNYLEDMPNIPGYKDYIKDPENYQLDKDIKQQGVPKYQQVYSPETCIFVHRNINVAYKSNTGLNNSIGYYGVREYHSSGNYVSQTNYNSANYYIGVYPNTELAAAAYNQFVLSHMLDKPLNPVPPITQAQVYNYDLRFGNKIEMCRIIDPSKQKEMCRIINK